MKNQLIDDITRQASDKGKIIELGWLGLVAVMMPPGVSEIQVKEMRKAFFCGAQHLFASILSILDPGTEATDKDLERMSLIANELQGFVEDELRKTL